MFVSTRRRSPLALTTALGLLFSAASAIAASPVSAEPTLASALGELANGARISAGLPTLARDPVLDAEAEAWANQLADRGALEHSSIARLRGLGYRRAAENIAYGPVDPSLIQGLFLSSAPHRENQLDPHYTEMGVGVVVRGDTIWVTELFAARAVPPSTTANTATGDRPGARRASPPSGRTRSVARPSSAAKTSRAAKPSSGARTSPAAKAVSAARSASAERASSAARSRVLRRARAAKKRDAVRSNPRRAVRSRSAVQPQR